MTAVTFPEGYRLEPLRRDHPRRTFHCGNSTVDDWLATKALQHQTKHLSVTRVLLDAAGDIAGYFSIAMGQVDFGDLPPETSKKLPRRMLPIAVLAWLGVSQSHQRQGLGTQLLAQALAECHAASRTFPFIAVVLDAIDEPSRQFYQRFDFTSLPGQPYRLFLSAQRLQAMMGS